MCSSDLFYNAEVSVLINLDAWKKLDDPQRAFLSKQALWVESLHPEYLTLNQDEIKKQAAAGIEVIKFDGEVAKQYLARAYDVGWKSIVDKSPEHGAKLKQLLSKPN